MEFSPFFPEKCFTSLEDSHLDVSCCPTSAGSWNFHSSASFGMKFIILSWLVFAAQIPGVDTALGVFLEYGCQLQTGSLWRPVFSHWVC